MAPVQDRLIQADRQQRRAVRRPVVVLGPEGVQEVRDLVRYEPQRADAFEAAVPLVVDQGVGQLVAVPGAERGRHVLLDPAAEVAGHLLEDATIAASLRGPTHGGGGSVGATLLRVPGQMVNRAFLGLFLRAHGKDL